MTTEEKLSTLSSEIAYHRRKAESLRRRAAAQDAIANMKVKKCAGLQTMGLPIAPLPAAVLFPARERMRKAIADCDERAYEKAQADLEKETPNAPPDQPPLKIGDTYYLKRFSAYRPCTLRSLTSTPGFPDTARVDYYVEGEPVICRQSELLTQEQYRAILKQCRKEAYERDAPERAMKARQRYADVTLHWDAGRRTAKEMYESAKTDTVRGWAERIAAAKRWKLIE